MENQPGTIGSLLENAGDYLETRLDLLKLQAVDKSSDVTSSFVSRIATLLVMLFAVTLINIALALWIGELVGKTFIGFFIVAGFYLLLAMLLHFFGKSWIKIPVANLLIKKMLANEKGD